VDCRRFWPVGLLTHFGRTREAGCARRTKGQDASPSLKTIDSSDSIPANAAAASEVASSARKARFWHKEECPPHQRHALAKKASPDRALAARNLLANPLVSRIELRWRGE
jgi:hypothetical protein